MQLYPGRDTFEFDQGHMTKNQPITVLILLRYHGRWISTKNGKKLFFAVQIEKTEINISPKNGEKSFFTFQDRREKLFLNLINGVLTSSCHL